MRIGTEYEGREETQKSEVGLFYRFESEPTTRVLLGRTRLEKADAVSGSRSIIRWRCSRNSTHMIKQIALNIPVVDLPKSLSFFKALGFSVNPEWTNDSGACIVISESINVMLSTHAKLGGGAREMLVKISRALEVTRTDFKRVIPIETPEPTPP